MTMGKDSFEPVSIQSLVFGAWRRLSDRLDVCVCVCVADDIGCCIRYNKRVVISIKRNWPINTVLNNPCYIWIFSAASLARRQITSAQAALCRFSVRNLPTIVCGFRSEIPART